MKRSVLPLVCAMMFGFAVLAQDEAQSSNLSGCDAGTCDRNVLVEALQSNPLERLDGTAPATSPVLLFPVDSGVPVECAGSPDHHVGRPDRSHNRSEQCGRA